MGFWVRRAASHQSALAEPKCVSVKAVLQDLKRALTFSDIDVAVAILDGLLGIPEVDMPLLEKDNLPALDSLPRGEKIPSRSTSSVSPLTPVSRSGRSRRAATARPMFGVCPDVGEADGLQRVPSRPRASQELRKLSKEAGKAEADGDGVVVASSVSCAGSAI
eukprot:TRINITY_DN9317_c0_g1_i8.p2 TRINITY_DN9317_c0_g1~~TRINITY_DN9317_c0_g1_i8.p2  ORF type:complete len:163 (+),score=16.61 TRINITY_DN9317_c0_g1_i8:97-585(+)